MLKSTDRACNIHDKVSFGITVLLEIPWLLSLTKPLSLQPSPPAQCCTTSASQRRKILRGCKGLLGHLCDSTRQPSAPCLPSTFTRTWLAVNLWYMKAQGTNPHPWWWTMCIDAFVDVYSWVFLSLGCATFFSFENYSRKRMPFLMLKLNIVSL